MLQEQLHNVCVSVRRCKLISTPHFHQREHLRRAGSGAAQPLCGHLKLQPTMLQRKIATSMHICAVLEEELHNSSVAPCRCKTQRLVVISMHICVVLGKKRQNSCLAILRCLPQRHVVVSMHICAVLDKELHNIMVTIRRRVAQRGITAYVNICAALDEQLHDFTVAIVRCPQQGTIESVHVRASIQKLLHRLDVPEPGRARHGLIHCGRQVAVRKMLNQRCTELVHAGSHHGADNSHVALVGRPLQASVVEHKSSHLRAVRIGAQDIALASSARRRGRPFARTRGAPALAWAGGAAPGRGRRRATSPPARAVLTAPRVQARPAPSCDGAR